MHQISDDDVRDKPSFAALAGEILSALAHGVPLAYNAEFDRAFLMAEFTRAGALLARVPPALRKGVDWIDPLIWARELQPDRVRLRGLGVSRGRQGERGQGRRQDHAHGKSSNLRASLVGTGGFCKAPQDRR